MDENLDPFIAALCDSAAQWLCMATMGAMALGLTIPQGIESMRPALHTGYQPEEVRRDHRARSYRDGRVAAPRRSTVADRVAAESRAWGLS